MTSIRVLAICALLLSAGACVKLIGFDFDLPLEQVRKTEAGVGEAVITDIKSTEERDRPKYIYEDDAIRIVWHTSIDFHHFRLSNKTDQALTILWDKAAYTGANGVSERIGHMTGGAFFRTTETGEPAVVAAGAAIEDAVFPVRKSLLRVYNQRLFKVDPTSRATSESTIAKLKGKRIIVDLPMEVRGQESGYRFVFLIRDITIKE